MLSGTKSVLALALLAFLLLADQAQAEDSWICSVTEAVACDEDGTVGPPNFHGLDRPTFFRVDPDRKEVTLLGPETRAGETNKINSMHQGDGVWLFSGAVNDRAWSIVISADGHMTLSVVMDGAVWSVFGSAIRED